jgi:hypothetical protein
MAWRRLPGRGLTFGLALLAALALGSGRLRAETEVDLALVIAVDVSYSMDPDEQTLQREGFIQAFQSPTVHDAIRRGLLGRIAVAYMEWAGAGDQKIILPWTVMDGPEDANAFAERLAEAPTRRAQRTSISGAIDFAAKLLAEGGFSTGRQVIDVSGDGPNNQGRPVTMARDEALARGITINGLPIMLKAPGYFDIPDLDVYYRDCVIGGQGAFMVPAREREQFREAVKTKIILEVADRAPPEPLVQPAQLPAKRANCLAGELQWRDRMGN